MYVGLLNINRVSHLPINPSHAFIKIYIILFRPFANVILIKSNYFVLHHLAHSTSFSGNQFELNTKNSQAVGVPHRSRL